MRQARGFTVIEILMALGMAAVGLLVILSVFSSSSAHALQSRNRSVAILMANSLMDDIESHTYGDPEPTAWTVEDEEPVTVYVVGRQQHMRFHKQIRYENGSFVGQSAGNSDVVTLTITWKEGPGDDQVQQAGSNDNKELEIRVPVWR